MKFTSFQSLGIYSAILFIKDFLSSPYRDEVPVLMDGTGYEQSLKACQSGKDSKSVKIKFP